MKKITDSLFEKFTDQTIDPSAMKTVQGGTRYYGGSIIGDYSYTDFYDDSDGSHGTIDHTGVYIGNIGYVKAPPPQPKPNEGLKPI